MTRIGSNLERRRRVRECPEKESLKNGRQEAKDEQTRAEERRKESAGEKEGKELNARASER